MTWNDDVRAALHDENLRSRVDLAWLNVPYAVTSSAVDRPDLLRTAVTDLTQAFEAAPLAPGAFQGTISVLLEAPATVRVTLGLLLSAARAPRQEERRERALVAAALFESALGEFTHASIAVRLARLRAELGDERARFAWKEALRRDLTLTWLPPADLRSRPDLTVIEGELVLETSGFEGRLRSALQTLRETRSVDALDALMGEAGTASSQHRQVWWMAVAADRLGKTLLLRPGTQEFIDACQVARGSISRVEDSQVAALLSAQLAIVERRKADAVSHLTATGVSAGAASAAVDAIAEVIRKPPHDVAAVLSAAYFDAVFDPLTALEVPRGLLSGYRKLLLGTAIGAMLLGPIALQTAQADVGTPDLNAAIVAAVHGEHAVEKVSAPGAEEGTRDAGGSAAKESKGAKDGGDFFADADELGAHAAGTDLVQTLSSMVKADLSDAHADGVIRTFAQAKGKDRQELRSALAKVLSDPELTAWIDASASRVSLANELVKRVAPTDLSIAENREVNKVVDSFTEFDKYKYHVIIVTGYTPADTTTASPDVHPVGMARLRDAFDAWKRGDAPFILLSGSNVYPPGTPYYEAIQMKKELVQMGVPADRIIVDARARHSTTNLRNAGRYMHAHGMTKALVASRGGGAGPFDQTFYFAHQGLSSFDSRCERELGYVVGTLTDAGNSMVEFQPAANVGRFNYKDPLDP